MNASVTAIREVQGTRRARRAARPRALERPASEPAPRSGGRMWLNGRELGDRHDRFAYLTNSYD